MTKAAANADWIRPISRAGQGLGNETASAANSLCCGLGEGVLGSGIVMG